jgi:hypothetical protein
VREVEKSKRERKIILSLGLPEWGRIERYAFRSNFFSLPRLFIGPRSF